MTTADKIAALPTMPPDTSGDLGFANEMFYRTYQAQMVVALRARLELAVEVMERFIDPNITGHCGYAGCDECNGQAELRRVLAALKEA